MTDHDAAYDQFLQEWPDYRDTVALDERRATDYPRLDADGHVYLDYTGAGLYADSQVRAHTEWLQSGVFGNPHSANVTSSATTTLVERTRGAILAFFGAPPGEYTVVFTTNATAALKLVGEAFPFEAGSRCLFTFDNHNSVNGIRQFAGARGATVEYVPLGVPDLRVDATRLDDAFARADPSHPNLFAFPAQSNFSGVRHSLEAVTRAQAHGWHVVLDAAALVPTTRLDLATCRPDFVSVSFYKMFGYPTGVGCLLARTDALGILQRPWFAGGTVNFATVQGRAHILAPREAGFEDGTVDFLSIPAVEIGLRHLEAIGLETIQTRVRCLTGWTLARLLELTHTNGRHLVRLYGPTTTEMRGGTIAFNVYDPEGRLIDYRRVEELASREYISLRTGCFCNPGVGESAEELTEADMLAGLSQGGDLTLPRFLQVIQYRGGKSAGALRTSFGLASNFADAFRFVEFVARFRDQAQLTVGTASFDIDACRVIRDGS